MNVTSIRDSKSLLNHQLIDLLILFFLLFIILLQILTYINHKSQLKRLYNLFNDFTRFYIHISKPPSKEITNPDFLIEIPSKKSSNSISSYVSISNSDTIKTSNGTVDQNGNLVKNFKSRLLQIARPPSHSQSVNPALNYNSYSKYLAVNSNLKAKIDKNQRRHSTIDLINRSDILSDSKDINKDKFKEKTHFKVKQSESYSFDMNNNLFSNVIVNEVKEKSNFSMKKLDTSRRPRLLGISDEIGFGNDKNECSSYTSTSTPNK